jgi:protein involved in polysaccharide export with SLBB domain
MRRDLHHLQFGIPRLTAGLCVMLGATAAGAQVVGVAPATSDARVARIVVDSAAGSIGRIDMSEAALRRAREGDLHVGDRVVLKVPGVATLTDTFVVRAGRQLELPQIPAIPLTGVARADLEHHLRLELARYVRDTAAVEARSLTRISVVGDVNAPGYYAVAPDALVGDVLMRAGGLARTADAERIMVRRGSEELLKAEQLRKAIVAGQTLDELGLRAGDEIVVPAKRDWTEYARTAALVAGAVVSVILVRHR